MTTPTSEWENLFIGATPEGIILVGFKSDALKPLTGKTLAAIAKERGKPSEQVAIDLIIEDDNDPQAICFLEGDEVLVARVLAEPARKSSIRAGMRVRLQEHALGCG